MGFASHWFKNSQEIFKPVIKLSNRNGVFNFDSHVKTALIARTRSQKNHQYKQTMSDQIKSDYMVDQRSAAESIK